jgi:PKD repeat protein
MMKKLPLFGLGILLLAACSDDSSTEPAFDATFDASRAVAEMNERISFDNTTSGAVRYEWDFGNGQKSTTDTASTRYDNTGTYTVKLTAYNADNRAATTTKTVRIGRPYLSRLQIAAMNFLDSSGMPWDADGSGPDMYFRLQFRVNQQTVPVTTATINDVQANSLPVNWDIVPTQMPAIDEGPVTVSVYEVTPGQAERRMFINMTPAVRSANRDAEGNGSFEIKPIGSPWRFVFYYKTL